MIIFTEKKKGMRLWRTPDFTVYLLGNKYSVKFTEYIYKKGQFHHAEDGEIKGTFKDIEDIADAIERSPHRALSKISANQFVQNIRDGKYTLDEPKGIPVFKKTSKRRFDCNYKGILIQIEGVGKNQMMVTVEVDGKRRRYGGEKQNPELVIAMAMRGWTDLQQKNSHYLQLLQMIKQGTVKWVR